LQGILSTNAAELRPLLLAFAEQLTRAADALDDPPAIDRLWSAANRHRRSFGSS
jgi:hypothetical protein